MSFRVGKEERSEASSVRVCGSLESLTAFWMKSEGAWFRFGRITRKAVIYRGESRMAGEISYINVEEYLKGLDRGRTGNCPQSDPVL